MKHLPTLILVLLVLGGCDSFQKKGTWSCYNENTIFSQDRSQVYSASATLITFDLDNEVYRYQRGDTYLKGMEGEVEEKHLEIARKLDSNDYYDKLVIIQNNNVFIELKTTERGAFKLQRIKPDSHEAVMYSGKVFKCNFERY